MFGATEKRFLFKEDSVARFAAYASAEEATNLCDEVVLLTDGRVLGHLTFVACYLLLYKLDAGGVVLLTQHGKPFLPACYVCGKQAVYTVTLELTLCSVSCSVLFVGEPQMRISPSTGMACDACCSAARDFSTLVTYLN